MATKNKPNELYLTRTYNAPVKMVWDAWVDPKQVAKWWGPRGFTITTHYKDVKTGGSWSYIMHGPDGTNYPNYTKFLEVEKHSRLVYDHGAAAEDKAPLFRVTVLFSENKGKTTMEMTMALATPEAAQEIKKFIKKAGGDSTWDRLAEHLEEETSGQDVFVINRSFDAPIDLVYEMWTDPKHFAKWLPPTGATMKFMKADIKTGGSTFYKMEGDYGVMYGRAQYLEMNTPHRIVYTQQFTDENEKVARHPLSPKWPETMLTTVQLSEEAPNKTRVTITWTPHGKNSSEELDTFKKARSGMTQGWSGSFDKLEEYLAKN